MKRVGYLYLIMCALAIITHAKVSDISALTWRNSFDRAIARSNAEEALANFIKLEGAHTFNKAKEEELLSLKDQLDILLVVEKKSLIAKKAFATHGLFIFLDDSEKAAGAISIELLIALGQKVPCLVSTSLLKTIFEIPSLSDISENYNAGFNRFKNYYDALTIKAREIGQKNIQGEAEQQAEITQLNTLFTGPSLDLLKSSVVYLRESYRVQILLLKDVASFQPHEWLIRFVDASKRLCLLLPKTYKNLLNPYLNLAHYASPKRRIEDNELTPAEYITGLKIDHMVEVSDIAAELRAYTRPSSFGNDYFFPSVWNEKMKRSDIFVTLDEYRKAGKNMHPRWTLYMTGHGSPNGTQASLGLYDFKGLLTFLDSHIQTKVFAYSTCFAQGTNVELIYKEGYGSGIDKTYSFAIATEGIADKVTYAIYEIPLSKFKRDNIDFTGKSSTGLVVETDYHYAQFLTEAAGQNVDFEKIFGCLMKLQYNSQVKLLTVPYYRLPGQKQFKIIDPEHRAARIDSAFTKEHVDKSVDLQEYFIAKNGIKPRCYFLDTPYIPCDFLFNFFSYDLPIIIPNAAKDFFWVTKEKQLYFIRKAASNTLSLNNFVNLFVRALLSTGNFTVLVDQAEFNGGGGLFLVTGKIFITNLRINYYMQGNQRRYSVAFTYNGDVYSNDLPDKPVIKKVGSSADELKKLYDLEYQEIQRYRNIHR